MGVLFKELRAQIQRNNSNLIGGTASASCEPLPYQTNASELALRILQIKPPVELQHLCTDLIALSTIRTNIPEMHYSFKGKENERVVVENDNIEVIDPCRFDFSTLEFYEHEPVLRVESKVAPADARGKGNVRQEPNLVVVDDPPHRLGSLQHGSPDPSPHFIKESPLSR